MRNPNLKNIPASVRQKLLNLAQKRNDDFGLILTKYGLERILFRLSKSKYRNIFVLKGALLFELWTRNGIVQRATPIFWRQEIALRSDLSSYSRSSRHLNSDALRFDAKTVKADRIKENADYEGVRVTLIAFLDKAKFPSKLTSASEIPSHLGRLKQIIRHFWIFRVLTCSRILTKLLFPKNSKQ